MKMESILWIHEDEATDGLLRRKIAKGYGEKTKVMLNFDGEDLTGTCLVLLKAG
jgi:hypothetical protein